MRTRMEEGRYTLQLVNDLRTSGLTDIVSTQLKILVDQQREFIWGVDPLTSVRRTKHFGRFSCG